MNWYIGQEIVCIKTHSQEIVKEGETFIVKGLKQGCCHVHIDVGINSKTGYTKCSNCKSKTPNGGTWWINEVLFKPLDSIADISELTEILKKPVEHLFEVK